MWAKVLMPAMSEKTQAENDNTPLLPNGQRAGIRERVIGTKEAYNFKNQPDATGARCLAYCRIGNGGKGDYGCRGGKILVENGKEDYVNCLHANPGKIGSRMGVIRFDESKMGTEGA